MDSSEHIAYEDKFVAFLDILGFSSLINQGKSESIKTIQFLTSLIRNALSFISEDDYLDDDLSVKLFSDCFCISSTDLYVILKEISFVQHYFSLDGVFIRGALAVGLHYEDDNIIYSKGLVDAYELDKKSKYPRVIVSEDVFSIFKDIISSEAPNYIARECILTSPDGIAFVNYLYQHPYYYDFPEEDTLLEAHRDSIIEQVKKNIDNASVLDKFKWAADYHNYYVRATHSPDDWDADYYQEMMNNLLVPSTIFPSFKE